MKTVLITGASRGIGRACAKLFAENGYNIAINYNNSFFEANSLLSELAHLNIGKKIYKADVSNDAECKNMILDIEKDFGEIDVLVNNAGISMHGLLSDISNDDWEKIFNVNVKSMFLCCKYASIGMISRKSGCIINISSVWGITGASCETAYSASKGAVISFTKALAKELAPSGIRVNSVAPGATKTDMLLSLGSDVINMIEDDIPLGKISSPQDIANCILFLASENSKSITGQIISPNGGLLI